MRRDGFTLIEVILALTLGALVVLIAHSVFAGVTDGTRRVSEARDHLDRAMNARRYLTESFGSLDVGADRGGFAGRPDRVEFSSWERTPEGWLTPTRVTIALAGDTLVATSLRRVALASHVRQVAFDYLLEPGAAERWMREWISPISAPVAVRMRTMRRGGADTLLFVVGRRG